MARISRSARLLRKAEAALISSIEIYNKPDFAYREETFAILALNAWELLLKAKILMNNHNDPRSIYLYEKRKTRSGDWSKKRYLKRNRAGNVYTMGLGQVMAKLDTKPVDRLPQPVKANLEALTEIRDNACHYMHPGTSLSKQVLEIGTAAVRNFVELAQRWFSRDLSEYNLYLMPIGFVVAPGVATAMKCCSDEANLINYLHSLILAERSSNTDELYVSLEVNISFKRSATDAVTTFAITDDPTAPKIIVTEEDIRKTYPWDYAELTLRLRKRYSDFKVNKAYHELRKSLMEDERLVRSRFLDPDNPKSSRKDYYNPNILEEFDKHYTRV